jgi:hypothetical protein
MGVQNPATSERPTAMASTSIVAARRVRPVPSLSAAWLTNPAPAMTRNNKRPTPGHPRAKLENSLRKVSPCLDQSVKDSCSLWKTPKESGNDSFEDQRPMIPRFKPIIAAWVRSFAPNLERMFLTLPFTVSSVMES